MITPLVKHGDKIIAGGAQPMRDIAPFCIRSYRPAHPSMWRDVRAIPFDLREGIAVIGSLAMWALIYAVFA